jgi:parvulin-like peptidyl-prolyl isomerase
MPFGLYNVEMLIASRARHALLTVLSLTLLVSACKGTGGAPAPASPDTWASVDGRAISRDQVEKSYRRTAQTTPAPSEEEALAAKLTLLNELIVQDILVNKAKALKLEVPDSELDTAYNEGRKDIPEAQFQQQLTARNLTAADMREELRREMLSQKVLDAEVTKKVAVSDAEVTAFFEANRSQFEFPEDAYRIGQIVVTPVREPQQTNRTGNDATTAQEANAKIQMLMERLKQGATFSDVAADFSEDGETAQRGGDLGFVPLSALQRAPQKLRDAVLKSEPGSVTLVSEGGGHTLVALIAMEPAGKRDPSMPEVKARITDAIRGRKEQLLRAAYLSAVRNNAAVVNHLAARLVAGQGALPKP